MARFGESRLVRPDLGIVEKTLFRVMGVLDPAHYLHHLGLRRALDGVPWLAPKRILDAGCGRGDHTMYLARRFPGAQVVGADINADLVRLGQETATSLQIGNVEFQELNLTALDPDEAFDLIVSIDVLEHIPEPRSVLALMQNVLTPKGYAYFHIPTTRQRPVPFSRHLESFDHWAEEEHLAEDLTAEEFVNVLEDLGFGIESVTRTFGYWTGELATSLFALPHAQSRRNKVLQGLLSPLCRLLVLLDPFAWDRHRFAVGVMMRSDAD